MTEEDRTQNPHACGDRGACPHCPIEWWGCQDCEGTGLCQECDDPDEDEHLEFE